MTIGEARLRAIAILQESQNARTSPNLDALILLSHTLSMDKTNVLTHPEIEMNDRETFFFDCVEKRSRGLPIAYITGTKEFWGLSFAVTSDVLIPKPDTEILVERAIYLLKVMGANPKVLDVCTGSGCIVVAIAKNVRDGEFHALDISPKALEIAARNAALNQTNVTFHESDASKPFPLPQSGQWDMIVTNPPYVPHHVATHLLEDGRSEPLLALDGGENGLDLFKPLFQNAFNSLRKDGIILAEAGEYNIHEARDYLIEQGFLDILIHKDLEGLPRILEGRKP